MASFSIVMIADADAKVRLRKLELSPCIPCTGAREVLVMIHIGMDFGGTKIEVAATMDAHGTFRSHYVGRIQ